MNDAGGGPVPRIGPFDMLAMFVSASIIGISVSPIMVDVGTPGWVVVAAAVFAWSGTGEVAYASVVAAGGGVAPAMAAALLVSSRFSLLAMSLKDRWPAALPERLGMYQWASEVAVAAAIDHGERGGPQAARQAYWRLVIPLAVGWVIGSGIGLWLGNIVGDPRQVGLDAVFPASFIGAVVNGLTRRDSAVAVIGGAGAALGLTPVLPAGLPVLVAAGAALLALAVPPTGARS